MNECERVEPIFVAYVAGELDEAALGPLLAHCRNCEECRQLVELHRDLAALASRAPQPDGADLAAMEARVLDRFDGAPIGRIRGMRMPARVTAALAASLLLFVAGLAAGRTLWGRPGPDVSAGLEGRMISAIRADAASNRALRDVEDSRFTYSDVSFRRAGGDRVALDFDVTTHVELVEPVRSELVQDVLVQALLNPSSAGARLRAMALASSGVTPKTKEALLFAMRRDTSLAVRLEALTVLSGRLSDPEVESAVLAALRDDQAVPMRLLALDALAAHSVDRGRIRDAIRENPRPGDEALRVRLARYEKQI
jgi:hypothetical protein